MVKKYISYRFFGLGGTNSVSNRIQKHNLNSKAIIFYIHFSQKRPFGTLCTRNLFLILTDWRKREAGIPELVLQNPYVQKNFFIKFRSILPL